jgi:uncharacterized protein (DUF697 family)/GTP-binding protein EngB required for normal cell division
VGAYGGAMTVEQGGAGASPRAATELGKAEIQGMFEQRLAEAFAALGTFNLAVFGKTGVGKSTLVNALFGRDVARTGVGQSVTKGLIYYRHPDGFLGLYDSEGFETGTAGNVILDGLKELVADHAGRPVDEQIHAAWYLVRWSDRRFEGAQAEFVRALHSVGLPVCVVMTQVPTKSGVIHPDALELAAYIEGLGLPLAPHGHVILTNALHDSFTDAPVYGLQRLLDDTYEVVPEAATRALTAAQVVDMGRKKKAVDGIVNQAAVIAAGIGATPIPFADAVLLVPNQITMIARITAAYGLPPSRSRAMAAAGSIVLTGGATMAGKYAVTNLLKFVPGGAIAGSAISATVAASLTKAVGFAWARVCEYAMSLPADQRDRFLDSGEVTEKFVTFMKAGGVASVMTGLRRPKGA